MTEIYVKVNPDSDIFKVEEGTIPEVYLKSKAENGKANAELTRRLENLTGSEVGIISGQKSRRKKLKTDLSKQEFRQKLSDQ